MYKIDTGQARTDLYGMNKGDAQVFDTSVAQEGIVQGRKEKFARQQAENKLAQDRENDVTAQLGALNKISVLAREQPMFAEMQKGLYDKVKANIGKIRSGDTNALLDIQANINEIYTKAELSKNTREQIEKTAAAMLAKGRDKYRKASNDYIFDYATNPKYNGDYSFDPNMITERVNLSEYISDKLVGYAHEQAPNNRGYKKNTPEQRKKLITNSLAGDPLLLQAANDEFAEATDRLGATTPLEYAANKYESNLLVDDKPQLAEWQMGGNKTKRPEVAAVVTNKPDGSSSATINFTDKPDNPYLSIDNPNKPGEVLDVRPMEVIKKPDGKIVLKGATKAIGEGFDRKEGQVIEVDYNKVADVMNNTFGIDNPQGLFGGSAPSHVTVKQYNLKDDKKADDVPVITSQKAYDALPKGAKYKDSNGTVATKR